MCISDNDNDNDVYFTLVTSDSQIATYKTVVEQLTHKNNDRTVDNNIQQTTGKICHHYIQDIRKQLYLMYNTYLWLN